MNISVVYEDDDMLVVDKPSGIITHPQIGTRNTPSIASWIMQCYSDIANVGSDPLRHGIVHRLDKDTSGLLVIAKNNDSLKYLQNLFRDRGVRKSYIALVYGSVEKKHGTIDAPIGRIGNHQTIRTHGKKKLKERNARTEYTVLSHYDKYALLEVRPVTGRTHQIRVHLKSIGHPVVCDPWYAGRAYVCPPELDRMFLHAQKIEFTAPSGQRLMLEAGLPRVLQNFLIRLAKK